MKIKTISLIAGLAVSGIAAIGTFVPVNAVVLNLQYSGASFGNSATATGEIDIEPSFLIRGFFGGPINMINNLTLTISGATSGNGTFTKDDFRDFYFWSPSPLDFSQELVGKPVGPGNWGEAYIGDFNLFAAHPNAPKGVAPFILGTAGGTGDIIRLTSFAPVGSKPTQSVPEPSSLLGLLAVGTLGAGSLLRRKQQQKANKNSGERFA